MRSFNSFWSINWPVNGEKLRIVFAVVVICIANFNYSFARHKSDLEQCKQGEYHEGYALSGGKRAGLYKKLGTVEDFDECVELCCSNDDCKVALMLRTSCFQVTCDASRPMLCQPVPAKRSKYHPKLFRRLKEVSASASTGKTPVSSRNKGSCQVYSGDACGKYINQSAMYYVTSIPVNEIDNRLRKVVHYIEKQFDSPCREFALKSVCHYWLMQCENGTPSPTMLCKEDCNAFFRHQCIDEINDDIPSEVIAVLPDCRKLPWAKDQPLGSCLHIDGESVNKASASNVMLPTTVETLVTTADQKTVQTTMATTFAAIETTVPPPVRESISTPTTSSASESAGDTEVDQSGLLSNTTIPAPTIPSYLSTNPLSQHIPGKRLQETHATILKSNVSDQVDLSEEVSPSTIKIPTTKVPVTTQPPLTTTAHVTSTTIGSIKVSAGDNKVLTLPEDKVSLYASAWPKPAEGALYEYNWYQLSAPADSTGYMEGQHTSGIRLTKLDVVGVYQFKVVVTGTHSRGMGFVNVTVKPAPRLNHPPRADVQPKEQTITLPTNEVVIDGSKSSDDDKIATYKWELVKAPIDTDNKVEMVGETGPILQLKKLTSGVYTFKLTVTDSDGETDSIESTVIVNHEKDYPPVARAGNDVVLTMPKNHVTLYGNSSSDDKGIVSYEWSKSPNSPKVGDIQGTDKPSLKVSNLVVGDYTFILKVTDASGQSAESRVTVIVQPEKNLPPTADAGPDKDLVYPDDSTTLDATKSTDDQKIVKYLWEKISGPSSMAMKGQDKAKLHLTKLTEGKYVFSVTVTDERGLSSKDTVTVNVKKDANIPPIANAGPDMVVVLPNRATRLDGSKSKDDQWVMTYQWSRDGSSPAAGDVINGSDTTAILQLANLVEGVYTFTLAVTDNKGLIGYDSATIVVKDGADSLHLVELYLDVDILKFSEENKKQLLRKLSVLLNVDDGNVVVDWIRPAGYGKGMMLMFYVKAQNVDRKLDGQLVSDMIKQKIGYHGTLFDYKMLSVQPYICRNNCSGHGTCDKNTKQCVCDGFWMSNFFKANFAAMESNCDWSILYVSVSLFGILLLVIGIAWIMCYCFSRKSRPRRRGRYIAVRSEDADESKENIMLMSKGKLLGHSLTFTESDDSEEETTVFDKKRLMNGVHSNGSTNGIAKRFRDADL